MNLHAPKNLNWEKWLGLGLVLGGLSVLGWILFPAASEEVVYRVTSAETKAAAATVPVDTDFSIQIPAIGANAPIVADVDPLNSVVYQQALSRGVAQAKGTGKPGEGVNIFLFAHSSATYLLATRYNSVFYLLHKLEIGDDIHVWYQGVERIYHVKSKAFVPASETNYMKAGRGQEKLTLMTCWPPGTTLKRLIITAD